MKELTNYRIIKNDSNIKCNNCICLIDNNCNCSFKCLLPKDEIFITKGNELFGTALKEKRLYIKSNNIF